MFLCRPRVDISCSTFYVLLFALLHLIFSAHIILARVCEIPVIFTRVDQLLQYCCASFLLASHPLPRVSVSLGFRMERSVAGRKEPLDLLVAVRNDSSSKLSSLNIQLQQECRWSAHGHHDKMTRVMTSMVVVLGPEFGKMKSTPGSGTSDRGQSVAPVEESPRSDLMQRLNSGSGVRVQLVVPDNCLFSLQTTNVTITHSVGVMLGTPDCMAAPCIWTPLSVLPSTGTAGPAALPGATSAVPPQTVPDLPRNTVPLQTVPDLHRPTAQQYSAGPYGPAPTAPYPNNSPPSYGSAQTVPYPRQTVPDLRRPTAHQYSAGPYGPASTAPYPNNNPPPGATYSSSPGRVPDMPYPSQQPVPYATAVGMNAFRNVTPAL